MPRLGGLKSRGSIKGHSDLLGFLCVKVAGQGGRSVHCVL